MQEHQQELEEIQIHINELEDRLARATEQANIDAESKYEKRLQLIKKMHEEEIFEIRQLNSKKEAELEQLAIKGQLEKQEMFAKAKQEAKIEEQKKRARFQAKLENIKKQEIAEFKRIFLGNQLFQDQVNVVNQTTVSVSQND